MTNQEVRLENDKINILEEISRQLYLHNKMEMYKAMKENNEIDGQEFCHLMDNFAKEIERG